NISQWRNADLAENAAESDFSAAIPQSGNNDYSKTNVQTQGMDEGDIVKTDGQYIYKLSSNGCYIISVANGSMTLFPPLEIENYVPKEMYISGNKLVIIGGVYSYIPSFSSGLAITIEPAMDLGGYFYSYCNKTDIRVYDITYKNAPTLERHLTIDGSYKTSRIIESENKLFYLVDYYFNYGNEDTYIPKVSDSTINDGEIQPVPAENISYYTDVSNYSYLILGQIDLDAPAEDAITEAYLGLGGTIYVSLEHIFVATYDYASAYRVNEKGKLLKTAPQTRIVKLGVSDLQHKAEGWVDGTIKDRLSMDEYDGFLRVATTVRNWWSSLSSYNNLFVLKPDLTVAGKVTNIAPGETIYSARFNKEKGSIVTFQMVDPYFSFDLSDPYNPKIINEVKEDGVSYYIHYIGDTGYTIGVGQMSEVVSSPYGDWVQWTGLKVSLYDNVSPDAVTTIVLRGSVHSPLFYDPKALLYDEERGLFAFPYQNWTYRTANSEYYSHIEQGLAVFKFDLGKEKDEEKLVYRDTLSNIEKIELDSYYGYYNGWLSFVERGIRIGGYVYTISDREIKSYSLDTLTEVQALELYQIDEQPDDNHSGVTSNK
ncbi:MAG: beta-propeller domain-containing protein, partial [Clostridia bacterium]